MHNGKLEVACTEGKLFSDKVRLVYIIFYRVTNIKEDTIASSIPSVSWHQFL